MIHATRQKLIIIAITVKFVFWKGSIIVNIFYDASLNCLNAFFTSLIVCICVNNFISATINDIFLSNNNFWAWNDVNFLFKSANINIVFLNRCDAVFTDISSFFCDFDPINIVFGNIIKVINAILSNLL